MLTDKLSIGSWITLAHPAIAEIMAKSGFDWLAIDLEHSVITIREAEELIRIIDLCNCIPFVRLTSNNPDQIKRVMDAGAHGVIVPMVNSYEDATKAVEAVKYPPSGVRSVGLARAQGYGTKFNDYKSWLNKSSYVIVQIEHIDAVNNLEKILSVEGVNGFIVGPYDLSASMGMPGEFENEEFKKIMKRVQEITKSLGATGGVHIIEPNPKELSDKISDGYNFIAYSLDVRMLSAACVNGLQHLKSGN